MTTIIKKKPEKGLTVYFPEGYRSDPEDFIPFFDDPEPSPDLRENSRPQRRIFHVTTEKGKYHLKKFSYVLSSRFEDNFKGFFYRRTPAKMQMKNSLVLERLDLKTILPWLVIEKQSGIKKESLFITPFIDKPSLFEILSSPEVSMTDKKQLFRQAVVGIKLLHRKKISHRDAHTKNFLVDKENLIWCDIDKIKKGRILLELKGRIRDCYYLLRSTSEALISAESWTPEIKKQVLNLFEENYPVEKLPKEKFYRMVAESMNGF